MVGLSRAADASILTFTLQYLLMLFFGFAGSVRRFLSPPHRHKRCMIALGEYKHYMKPLFLYSNSYAPHATSFMAVLIRMLKTLPDIRLEDFCTKTFCSCFSAPHHLRAWLINIHIFSTMITWCWCMQSRMLMNKIVKVPKNN